MHVMPPSNDAFDSFRLNVGVESFATHTRNLYVFAHEERPRRREMHASDWIDGWSNMCPPWTFEERTHSVQERVGREIAHLDWARTRIKNDPWPQTDLLNHFAQVAEVFCANVAQSKLSERWTTQPFIGRHVGTQFSIAMK